LYNNENDDRGEPVAYLEFNSTIFPLFNGDNIIGRSERCDIAIEDASVSNRHAEICIENDTYRIKDLRSCNGTYIQNKEQKGKYEKLNRNKITHLEDEMVVKFGNFICCFLFAPTARSNNIDIHRNACQSKETNTSTQQIEEIPTLIDEDDKFMFDNILNTSIGTTVSSPTATEIMPAVVYKVEDIPTINIEKTYEMFQRIILLSTIRWILIQRYQKIFWLQSMKSDMMNQHHPGRSPLL